MLLEKINNDLKEAMKSRNEGVVSTLRFLLSAIHNKEIALGPDVSEKGLGDDEVIGVIRQQIKQRKESIEAFRAGKRDDLAQKEQSEHDILNTYLPQQMSLEELENLVEETINELGVSDIANFGKVMGVVMARVKGKVDGTRVAEVVRKLLTE